MKMNIGAKLRGAFSKASLSSRVMFILCMLGAVMCVATNFEGVMVLTTGLLGVLWLSSIAMHAFSKRGHAARFNPFTPLLVLCLVIAVICQMISANLNWNYHEAGEPLNQFSDWFEESIMEAGVPLDEPERIGRWVDSCFYGTDNNLIITDENNKVVYSNGTWRVGKADTLRALVCPASFYSGEGLMILLDGRDNVLAPVAVDRGYIADTLRESGGTLTISEEKETRDPLYEKYFPSFGPYIDREAIALSYSRLYVHEGEGPLPYVEDYKRDAPAGTREISVSQWTTETVFGFSYDVRNQAEVAAELNALTPEQRESLKKYISWLDSAVDSLSENGYGRYYCARTYASPDGLYHAYLLYGYDQEMIYPMRSKWQADQYRRHYYDSFSLCMIPAIIVFLAFWVFVDAKKRGQKAPALWAILTLIGNVVAWIIYLMVRPQMVKNAAGQPMAKGVCPICGTKLKSDFIACPGCGILLRSRCKNCGKALENDWSFCPYCTQAVAKDEAAAQENADRTAASGAERAEALAGAADEPGLEGAAAVQETAENEADAETAADGSGKDE